MKGAAGVEFAGEQLNERRLDDAPFVVALLVPGVGEEELDAVEGAVGDVALQDDDRVFTHGAHVFDLALLQPVQQMADAGAVYFDAEVVAPGVVGGHLGQRFAVAETDLQHHRVVVAEGGGQIDQPLFR